MSYKTIDNKFSKEKGHLIRVIKKLKKDITGGELSEINKLYDEYFSPQNADIIRLRSYRDYLRSYLHAKYQNKKYQKYDKELKEFNGQ